MMWIKGFQILFSIRGFQILQNIDDCQTLSSQVKRARDPVTLSTPPTKAGILPDEYDDHSDNDENDTPPDLSESPSFLR